MKPKTLILIALALGCGGVAAVLSGQLLSQQKNTEEVERVQVLVARQNLQMGTLLKEPEKYFVKKEFIKGQEPKKAILDFGQLKERRLNKPLSADNFVTADDLMSADQVGLSAAVPTGKRATAIKVNAAAIAGGFVLPNTQVDVLHTVRRGDADSYSEIILQDMLVLAVDTIAGGQGDRQAIIASTVTLAATPEEAQKLNLAAATGELGLMLRAYGDKERVSSKKIRIGDMNKTGQPAGGEETPADGASPVAGPKVPDVPSSAPGAATTVAERPAPPPPAPPKVHTLVIYNGEAVTKQPFVEGKDGKYTSGTPVERSDPVAGPEKKTEKSPEQPATDAKPASDKTDQPEKTDKTEKTEKTEKPKTDGRPAAPRADEK